jgi:hypothetical protein
VRDVVIRVALILLGSTPQQKALFSLAATLCIGLSTSAPAAIASDFGGTLFQCAHHPPVNIAGSHVYAYEADLTHYTEGVATYGAHSVTLTFPRKFQAFTITRQGESFSTDGARCQTDPN